MMDRIHEEFETDDPIEMGLAKYLSSDFEVKDIEHEPDRYMESDTFKVTDVDGYEYTYIVGDEYQMNDDAREYIRGLIDDIGIDGFGNDLYLDYVNTESLRDSLHSMYTDFFYDSPGDYIPEDLRELSELQKMHIEVLSNKINMSKRIINNLKSETSESEDVNDLIDSISEYIDDYNEKIQDIREYPDGDYSSDTIDEHLKDYLEGLGDLVDHAVEIGIEIDHFVDIEKMVEGIFEMDGYEIMSNYDGIVDSFYADGTEYYVYRYD